MKIKRKTKQKIVIGAFLCSFIVSSLFFLNNVSATTQNEEDLEVILHGSFSTTSDEIYGSSPMPIGTFSFFEEPELDISAFSHDTSRFELSNIQTTAFNSTTTANEVNKTVSFTKNNTEISAYSLSKPFDTNYELELNYSSGYNETFYNMNVIGSSTGNETSLEQNDGDIFSGTLQELEILPRDDYDHGYTAGETPGYWNSMPWPFDDIWIPAIPYIVYMNDYYNRPDLTETLPNYDYYEFRVGSDTYHTTWLSYEVDLDPILVANIKSGVEYTLNINYRSRSSGEVNDPIVSLQHKYYLVDGDQQMQTHNYVGGAGHPETEWKNYDYNFTVRDDNLYEDRCVRIKFYNYVNFYQTHELHITNMEINLIEFLGFDNNLYFNVSAYDKTTSQTNNIQTCFLNTNYSVDDATVPVNFQLWNGTGYETIDTFSNEEYVYKQVELTDELAELSEFHFRFNIETGTGWEDQEIFVDCLNLTTYYYGAGAFDYINVTNFHYVVLGIDYYQNITLSISESTPINSSWCSTVYTFSSGDLEHYDYTTDASFPTQNASYFFDITTNVTVYNIDLTTFYSSNEWVVPTTVDLNVNGEDVIDSTYNSGFVLLSTYSETLTITATSSVYFRLNVTVDFSFTFDLEVISKTYLRKRFELESDHAITLDTLDLDDNLQIKKIYLNNVDKGSSDPCSLSTVMYEGNVFTLEIILQDELHLPLAYIYNNLGSGTSNIYLSGISNTLTYSNIDGNQDFNINLPSGWNSEYADLTFSDIEYNPDYTPNYAEDESGFGYGNANYGSEDVSFGERYYQTNANGTKIAESGGSGYKNVYSEYFDALNGYMSHNYGDLDGYNSTYSVNDYLYMQNLFPQELKYEDWTSWVHDYNSEYISSSFDTNGVNLTSVLNENSYSTVPLNSSFIFTNGSKSSDGNFYEIDGDYASWKSEQGVGGGSSSITLVPNSDITTEWHTGGAGSSHYDRVDDYYDSVYYGTYILADDTDDGQIEQFGLTTDTINVSINSITFYLTYSKGSSISNDFKVDFYDGNSWLGEKTISLNLNVFTVGSASKEWTGLNLNQTEVNDLEVKLTAPSSIISPSNLPIYSFEVVLEGSEKSFVLNNSVVFQYDTPIFSNDTIDSRKMYYSHKTNESIEISFYIWNWDNSNWNLVNSSTNDVGFCDLYFILNSSHYDGSNTVKLKWYGNASVATSFELYIDKLLIEVNWTKTSGEIYSTIAKDIDFSFLDKYDIGYDEYQKLYNITIEFHYYITNLTNYQHFASFQDIYLADYTFHKELGLTEEDIGFITANDGDSNCEVSVILEKELHNYILDFYDNNGAGFGIWSNSFSDQSDGEINFWMYFEDTDKRTDISISDEGTKVVELRFEDDATVKYDDGSWHSASIYESNKWYFIKILFDSDSYSIYFNGTLITNDVSLSGGYDNGFDTFYIESDASESDYHFYMDAIDYSWINTTEFNYNFEFDSDGVSDFNILFNITNTLLEISNMNYTIFFKCLDTNNLTRIYQFFQYAPPISLDALQEQNGNWILNFTYSFIASSDLGLYNFYNSFNHSLLNIQIYVNSGDGWEDPVCFNYNTTQNNVEFSFNITQYLAGLGKYSFEDFYIKIYLAGNPSNFTLDNLTLFDFDSYFYEVSAIWITDTLVVSHQDISIYWKASDRYISNVEINELYDSNDNVIYNITLLENTLQSVSYYNVSAGFYELNFTFYDDYGNYEIWTVNFTIITSISISTGYKNPVFISEINTISVHIDTEYSITQIYYDNSSDYVLQYNNSSYPLYEYEFNFTLSYSVQTLYNISILVIGEHNDSFWVNITRLSVIERTVFLDINHLMYSYYQDEVLNTTVSFRDLYNNPIQNKLLNYTIEDSNGLSICDNSSLTDSNGEINFGMSFSTSSPTGFYHVNVTFNGTEDYISCWKLESFQVRPILRSSNSSEINLQVNSNPVNNNFIRINHTRYFEITNYNSSLFDLTISLRLNYSENQAYSEYFDYSFEFSATSDVSSLTLSTANITNYPSNYTYYYYNDVISSNYAIESSTFQMLDLIGDTFYNDNEFDVKFRYYEDDFQRTQITSNPRTDSNSVVFTENLIAERTFSYWYILNSYDINTMSLNHTRTNNLIEYTDFTIEGSKYYFEESSLANDIYTATINYDPGWVIEYEVTIDNGTFCSIDITYQANFTIENVTMVLDLNSNNVYAENWTYSGAQSELTYILEIPNLNFSTTQQSLTVSGVSTVPYAIISKFANIEGISISMEDYDELDESYVGLLEYPKFSQSFIVYDLRDEWELDGVHYGSDDYDITSNGLFECEGWGTGIASSYLLFKVNPIGDIDRYVNYHSEYTEVVYRISTNLPIYGGEFEFYIENDEPYTILEISLEGEEVAKSDYNQIKLYKYEGKDYYLVSSGVDLPEGTTKIKIKYREESMANNTGLYLAFFGGLVFFGLVIWRLRIVMKESQKRKLTRKDAFLMMFYFWRIKPEKVKKKYELVEVKPTWEELKKQKEIKKKKKEEKKRKKKGE